MGRASRSRRSRGVTDGSSIVIFTLNARTAVRYTRARNHRMVAYVRRWYGSVCIRRPNPLVIHRPRDTASATISPASQAVMSHSSRSPRSSCGPGRSSRPVSPDTTATRASSGNKTMRAIPMTTTSGASTRRRISRGGGILGPFVWACAICHGPAPWERYPSGLSGPSGPSGKISHGRFVGPFNIRIHVGLIAVAELGQVRRPQGSAGRQHMHGHIVLQGRDLFVEAVPAGDLEGDQPHFPEPFRRGQRALDPPDLQHVHGPGAQLDGAPDRDRVDQAAVEVVLTVDLHRRQ